MRSKRTRKQPARNGALLQQAEKLRDDFSAFVKWAWEFICPQPLRWAGYLDVLCSKYQSVAPGCKLALSLSPRTGKSTILILWSIWYWLSHPTVRYLCASYNYDLGTAFNMLGRELMLNEAFTDLYGDMVNPDYNNRRDLFYNYSLAFRKVVSQESHLTGTGMEILLIDDPQDARRTNDQKYIEATKEWLGYLMTRLNDYERAIIISNMQRLAPNDAQQWCIDAGFEYVAIPFLDASGTPINDRIKNVDQFIKQVGIQTWEAQYMQNPQALSSVILPAMIQRYDTLPANNTTFLSVDLATTSKQSSDDTAMVVCSLAADTLYIQRIVAAHIPAGEIQERILQLVQQFNCAYAIVEEYSGSQILIGELQKKLYVKPYKSQTDKQTRAIPLLLRLQNGTIRFSRTIEYEHINTLLAYPCNTKWDVIDAISFACSTQGATTIRSGGNRMYSTGDKMIW